MKVTKEKRRQKIRWRIRRKVKGTAARPRLSVFRSNKSIYAQVIDDAKGVTLCSASSAEAAVDKSVNKTAQAAQVGQILGKRAMDAGVNTVVFDRGGYLYHGRVKALADGAREGGLKF
jgi:large subunit ribosomal protein L18